MKKTLKALKEKIHVVTKDYESNEHQIFHQHARKKCDIVFKVQRENHLGPGILHLVKLSNMKAK
jgi:hypothetical protein